MPGGSGRPSRSRPGQDAGSRCSMPWRETLEPARMQRVAVVAAQDRLRSVRLILASRGCVEPELLTVPGTEAEAVLQRVQALGSREPTTPMLSPETPDLAALERVGDAASLAGEVQLQRVEASMIRQGSTAALAGWAPSSELDQLAQLLAPEGAGVGRGRPSRG